MQIFIKYVAGTSNWIKTIWAQMGFSRAPKTQAPTFKQDLVLLENTGLPPQLQIHTCTQKFPGDGF